MVLSKLCIGDQAMYNLGSKESESDEASVHNVATNTQQQPNIQPQIITTVSNNNAKFLYLKKDEYESILDDHVADFHYMDDARDIWNAVKARFGGNAESKRMIKSMLKQEFLEFRIGEAKGLHKGYDRMQKILNVKGYTTFSSSQSAGPSHSAFVSATSASKKMSYGDSLNYSSTSTYSVPSNSKTGSHISEKLDLEEKDLKWQMAMLSVRVHKFEQKDGRKINFDKKESSRFNKKKEIGKKEEDSKALITVDTLVNWTDHNGKSERFIASKEFGMIAGCDTEDAIEEGASKIYNLITGADTEEASTAGDAGEFALIGVTSEKVLQRNQLTLEDKIRVLSIELENTSNLLKHSERINADVETGDLQTKLDNHL
nr:ribonuclease H-like domain-containing protein [Tanacetum cinerariifolium]